MERPLKPSTSMPRAFGHEKPAAHEKADAERTNDHFQVSQVLVEVVQDGKKAWIGFVVEGGRVQQERQDLAWASIKERIGELDAESETSASDHSIERSGTVANALIQSVEQLLEVATRGGGLGHDSPTRTLAVEKFVSELRASSEAKGWNSNNFDFSLRYAEQIERALAQNEIEILNFWLLPLAKRMAGPDGAWPWEGTSRGSLADCAWIEMARSSSEHFATVYFADLETGQLWLEASPLTHARSFGPLGLKLEIGFAHAAHRGDVRYAVLDQYALAGFAEASDFLRLASLARSDFQSLSDAAQASFACAEELPVLLRSVKLSDGSLIDAQGHRLPLLDAQHVSTALQANRVQDENFEVAAASTQSSMQSWSGATTLSSFSLAGDALWTGSLRLSRGKLCFRAFSVLLLAESDRGLIRLR